MLKEFLHSLITSILKPQIVESGPIHTSLQKLWEWQTRFYSSLILVRLFSEDETLKKFDSNTYEYHVARSRNINQYRGREKIIRDATPTLFSSVQYATRTDTNSAIRTVMSTSELHAIYQRSINHRTIIGFDTNECLYLTRVYKFTGHRFTPYLFSFPTSICYLKWY